MTVTLMYRYCRRYPRPLLGWALAIIPVLWATPVMAAALYHFLLGR